MGFFGKLFEKKVCSVCDGEIGLLGNRKLEDGNLCKECAKKLSRWFDDRRHSTVEQIKAVLPARWHNTVIQLLASCGLVGLLCYSVHRLQTIGMFWQKRHSDVVFIGFSVLALLIMSLLDCHFFNIGPTLFYSIALAFAEHLESEN